MSAGVRVGVIGAGGRMGSTVCAAVNAAPDMDLVAGIDPQAVGSETIPGGPAIEADLGALAEARADIAVDFTVEIGRAHV